MPGTYYFRVANRLADEDIMKERGRVRETFTATITVDFEAYGRDDAIDVVESFLHYAKYDGCHEPFVGFRPRLLRRSVKVKGT